MKNIAIFASGSGTNAENIARLFHQGNRIRVAVVVSNKKNAGVHQRMEALGVPTLYLPNSVWDNDPAQVVDALRPYAPDLVVLAGFMRTIQPAIIDAYRGRMLNIHPSLLPAYGGKGMYGHHVHEAVMAAGEKQSGVTVHYVSDEIDGGEILMQQSVDIVPGDTAETLEAKIHPVEYSLYPRAIVAALQRLDNDGLPSSHAVTEVSATPERAEADHKAHEVPAAPPVPSADEEWAGVLQVKYSDSEARSAAERVSRQAQPPVPTQQPPAVPPRTLPDGERPKSYLAWSVAVTILCCTVAGIVAIIYSASVSSRLSAGDMAGARRASDRAQGWIIASFVLGVLWATLWVPISMLKTVLF